MVATLFNVLAEYSLRGINNLSHSPLILPGIFLNYFFYFACLEYLIVHYKLRDFSIGVIGLFFGLLWLVLGPSVVYIAPQFLGVNWINFLFINLIWWVPIQTILGLYIARRLVTTDRTNPFLSEKQFKYMFYAFCLATFSFSLVLPFFPIAPLGRIILIFLTYVVGRYAQKKTLQSNVNISLISNSRFLDLVSIFVVIFFVYSSIVLTKEPLLKHSSFMNMDAIRLGFRIHPLIALSIYARRFIFKKEIPV